MTKKIFFLITLITLNIFFPLFKIKAAETDFTLEMTASTETPTPTSSPSNSSSSTSSSSGWSAPVCTATKPSSAPVIIKTASGDNSVTLTWSKAGNPVTKYLVAYGTKSGSIEYGNPNVGNEDTTS